MLKPVYPRKDPQGLFNRTQNDHYILIHRHSEHSEQLPFLVGAGYGQGQAKKMARRNHLCLSSLNTGQGSDSPVTVVATSKAF